MRCALAGRIKASFFACDAAMRVTSRRSPPIADKSSNCRCVKLSQFSSDTDLQQKGEIVGKRPDR
jgi:hypothetical protein